MNHRTKMRTASLALIVTSLILIFATLSRGQQPGRPRRVPTKASVPLPCNPRDFIQAVDTSIRSICNEDGSWADVATAAGGAAGNVNGPASSTDNAVPRYDGAGGKTLQNSTATVSDAGDLNVAGSLNVGSGGGPGFIQFPQGATPPVIVANAFQLVAPAAVTGYQFIFPGTSATGFVFGTNAANVNTLSFIGSSGTGNVCLTTSCSMITPALGTPSAVVLSNATGLPEGGLSLTDIATNNSSTSKHGFLKKLSNSATEFMNGQGNWATPAGGATNGATNGQVPISDGTNFTGDADLTFSGDTLSATKVASGQGTIINPAFCVGPCANQTGVWGVGAGFLSFSASGSHRLSMNDTFFEFPANQIVAWVSGVAPFGTAEDTTISRKSAGIIRFGTTTGNSAGSIEFTGFTAVGATQTLSNAAFTTCTALTTSSNVLTCTVSDRNLKQGFQPFTRGLSFVRNVKPQTYSFKEGTRWYDGGRQRLGLVAQEVQRYLPSAVFPIGPDQPLQIDYNAVTAATLQVLQSVEARVTVLEKENKRLRRILRRHR